MIAPPRLIAQIAVETGLGEDDIALASYLLALAQVGRTIANAASVCGLTRNAAASIADRWRIDFIDFRWMRDGPARDAPVGRLDLDPAGSPNPDAPAAGTAGVSITCPIGAFGSGLQTTASGD